MGEVAKVTSICGSFQLKYADNYHQHHRLSDFSFYILNNLNSTSLILTYHIFNTNIWQKRKKKKNWAYKKMRLEIISCVKGNDLLIRLVVILVENRLKSSNEIQWTNNEFDPLFNADYNYARIYIVKCVFDWTMQSMCICVDDINIEIERAFCI